MGTQSKLLQRTAISAFLLFSGKKALCFSNQFHNSHSTTGNCRIDNPSLAMAEQPFLSASPAPPSQKRNMDEAKTLISRAISIGAPAYNAGDVAGCAKVYRETALEIAALIPKALQDGLEGTIQQQQQNSFRDADEEAWAFRKQFDSILDYQLPFVPAKIEIGSANGKVEGGDKTTNVTLEKFTDAMIPTEPYVVNDNVMGGVSRGEWHSGSKTFRGTTSLANNGGFSSLRWRFDRILNWSYAKGVYLKKVEHSSPAQHTFRLILKDTTCEQVRGANFKTIFANPDNDSDSDNDTIFIPFEAFDQMESMGRMLNGAPVFNRGAVTELGLMAIKPTVVGDFELTIQEWGLYF